MNGSEPFLLSLAIFLLVVLIFYSLYLHFHAKSSKSAESQSQSLKNMLDEYAKKVQEDEGGIDEKFDLSGLVIPTKTLDKYDNTRAVEEMGLTQEEADNFVLELVKALESEIPRIEESILNADMKKLEEIVHTITGSSSTLGSGGVSSALISFYTAVQHRDSLQELYVHLQNVKYYLAELKKQTQIN
jgi:hypothetical protein